MKEHSNNPKGRKYNGETPNLNELQGIDLFPKKTAKAREILAKYPVPEHLLKRSKS
ncbi:hypothetical protein SAMN04487996_105289 [Dyadobacter soli]|uniref:Uncharacterized protein n=1 Tax=Dyadobacter soli TaxID=659014 RepID=A0A1G7DN49_9BACT|nr:hypothetical protein [Dyadobacter soli]SDE52888.1 hypothetical protein SAMN04487996_105289 [Dyadobacter soli]